MFCFDLGPLQIPHNLGDLLQSNMGTVDPPQLNKANIRGALTSHSIYSNTGGAKFFAERLFCKQITVQIKVLKRILLSRRMNNAVIFRQAAAHQSHATIPVNLLNRNTLRFAPKKTSTADLPKSSPNKTPTIASPLNVPFPN